MTLTEDNIITQIAAGKTIDEIYYSMSNFATREDVQRVWGKCFPLSKREWSALEDDILKQYHQHGAVEVQRQLGKNNFERTRIAIKNRIWIFNRNKNKVA